MELCALFDIEFGTLSRGRLPADWRDDPHLGRYPSIDAVVAAVRRIDRESDEVIRALLARGHDDETSTKVIIKSLMHFAIGRCKGNPERVAEVLSELVIVIADAREGRVAPTNRRLASMLWDRAWAKVRWADNRWRNGSTAGFSDDPLDWLAADATSPEDEVLHRLDAAELFGAVVDRVSEDEALSIEWQLAVALAPLADRTPSQRYRLKRARSRLRAAGVHELGA
jgi:hypothetical protein